MSEVFPTLKIHHQKPKLKSTHHPILQENQREERKRITHYHREWWFWEAFDDEMPLEFEVFVSRNVPKRLLLEKEFAGWRRRSRQEKGICKLRDWCRRRTGIMGFTNHDQISTCSCNCNIADRAFWSILLNY